MHMYYSLQDLTGESQFSNYDSKHYWDSFVASVELPMDCVFFVKYCLNAKSNK